MSYLDEHRGYERGLAHAVLLFKRSSEPLETIEAELQKNMKTFEVAKTLNAWFQSIKKGNWTFEKLPDDYQKAILYQAEKLLELNPDLKVK